MARRDEELPGIRWVLFLELIPLADRGQVLAPFLQLPLRPAVQLLGVLVQGEGAGRRRWGCCRGRGTAGAGVAGYPALLLLLLAQQSLALQLLPLELQLLLGWLRGIRLQFGGSDSLPVLVGVQGLAEEEGEVADAHEHTGSYL